MRSLFFLFCCFPLLLLGQRGVTPSKAPAADGSRRLALLIGNSAYQYSRPLSNPVHDVDSMEVVLREVGFNVIKVKNADRQAIEEALNEFTRLLKAEQYAVSPVFFAGHGLQLNGVHYLVPVEANPEHDLDGNTGRNSPYTMAMLRHLREPGLDIDQVFTKVTKTTGDLSAQQGKKQVSWKSSSLPEPFYFTSPHRL